MNHIVRQIRETSKTIEPMEPKWTPNHVPKPTRLQFAHIPVEARTAIVRDSKGTLEYISGQTRMQILFILPARPRSLEKWNRRAHWAHTWLTLALQWAPAACRASTTVYIYWTPLKKRLPAVKGQPLTEINANTAFTMSCDREILLFRSEEWFKVLIHESMHCFGLDFSEKARRDVEHYVASTLYALPSTATVHLYEAYAETWARLLNAAFVSVNTGDSLTRLLSAEVRHSGAVMANFLRHQGYTYDDLFDPAAMRTYKERTNAFAYYVLAYVLMSDYAAFVEWCRGNPRMDPSRQRALADYVAQHVRPALVPSSGVASLRMTVVDIEG
jgi:hypothetical protein